MKKTAKEICELINGELHGDPQIIVSNFSDIKNSKIGEKVLNFCFSLTTNEKLKLNEISLIINLIIQQRENLYKNENLVDSFLTDLKILLIRV